MTETPFVSDADFQLYVGDVREVLAGLPAESVHCVVTSPPYWGLRDYGTGLWEGGNTDCDHAPVSGLQGTSEASQRADRSFTGSTPQRQECSRCGARRVDQQLGLEPTPDEYVQNMVAVFREVRRVLRRDGTCWLNIGDSYNADHKQRPRENMGLNTGKARTHENRLAPGLKPKDLVGIPWRLAFALQADGWYLRADVIWSKCNPMPESVTDRPTKAHEYLFLLTRSPRYFYDADAIREQAEMRDYASWDERKANGEPPRRGFDAEMRPGNGAGLAPSPAGRNKRSVWEIATEPYPDAHFATFPQALVEPCVLAGTSERGCCPVCGAPWERETEAERLSPAAPSGNRELRRWDGEPEGQLGGRRIVRSTGWRPTCECHYERVNRLPEEEPVPCTVLDPFMGSGTTALVARRLGRNSIGCELNESYARLCADRLKQLSLFAVEAGGG